MPMLISTCHKTRAGHAHHQHRTITVFGPAGHPQAQQDEQGKKRQEDETTHKPPLFRPHRENKVRVFFRQEAQLVLGAVEKSLSPQHARTDGDLRLADVVASPQRIQIGAQKDEDASLLIGFQDMLPDRIEQRSNRAKLRSGYTSTGFPRKKSWLHEIARIVIAVPRSGWARISSTGIRMRISGGRQLLQVRIGGGFLGGEVACEINHNGYLHELGRLKLKARQLQPALRAIDILADEQDRKQQEERDEVNPQAHPFELVDSPPADCRT